MVQIVFLFMWHVFYSNFNAVEQMCFQLKRTHAAPTLINFDPEQE